MPRRSALDSLGLRTGEKIALQHASERTVAAVEISLSDVATSGNTSGYPVRFAVVAAPGREYKDYGVQSLPRFGTRCGWTARPLFSSVLARD